MIGHPLFSRAFLTQHPAKKLEAQVAAHALSGLASQMKKAQVHRHQGLWASIGSLYTPIVVWIGLHRQFGNSGFVVWPMVILIANSYYWSFLAWFWFNIIRELESWDQVLVAQWTVSPQRFIV